MVSPFNSSTDVTAGKPKALKPWAKAPPPKEKQAIILTRLYLCNNSKLEDIDEYTKIKNYFLNLDEKSFLSKIREFGLDVKEAS